MLYANQNNKRVKAHNNIKDAVCEICNKSVKPYCGKININHFRHIKKTDCDIWYEPITKWHLDWQNKFPENFREQIISKKGKIHRADIINTKNVVIEFQNSYIKPDEIKQRELFYNKMIWVFNGIKFRKNFNITFEHNVEYDNIEIPNKKNIKAYNWSYPKKHIYYCDKPVFIDFGTDYLYYINFIYKKQPLFRFTRSWEESNEFGNTWFENHTDYFFHPVKLISKIDFIKHYNV